jgi:hypothetical protein
MSTAMVAVLPAAVADRPPHAGGGFTRVPPNGPTMIMPVPSSAPWRRTRSISPPAPAPRVLRSIGILLTLLIAAGCLASFVAGPEEMAVRLIAGAAGLLIVLVFVWGASSRRRLPSRLLVDHEGIRVWYGRGRMLVRLAWTELSGVGVMTNERSRRRQRGDARGGLAPWLSNRIVRVPIWLELYPADAEAVARHPELERAWNLGAVKAPNEQRRWLVFAGDG